MRNGNIQEKNNKIKVLIVIGTFRTGGKERQISELVKGLSKNGYLVYFYSRNIIAHYFDNFKNLLSGYFNDKTTEYNAKTILNIVRYIRKVKPDIIHSWSTETSFIVNIFNLLQFNRYKIIDGSIRDSFRFKKYSSGWWQRFFCNRLSTKIISNTNAGLISYNCPPKKSTIVYNGISLERFSKHVLESTLEVQKKGIIVGMVATYCDKKDYKTFIEAGTEILKKNQNVQFVGIGNKFRDYYDKFIQLIPEKYKGSITLLDEKSNIEDYISMFDIGILFTNPEHGAEGISNSIMEYMTSGKPVVATNLGGTPEIVKDSYNGYLVSPNNVSECVDKITTLIEDDKLRKKMGDNAKETILNNFTFDQMIQKYISLYQTIK